MPLDLGAAVNACLRYARNLGQVAPHARYLTHLFLLLYGALPLLLFGPPTAMMGMSFPFLQKAVQTDVEGLGRRVGWLQAANIVGSTIGVVADRRRSAAVAGLLRNAPGAGRALGCLPAASGRLRAFRAVGGAWSSWSGAVALVALAVAVSPAPRRLWACLHGAPRIR